MVVALEWGASADDWLARWLFERMLATTYLVAFIAVVTQLRPLLGERGLLPIPSYVAAVDFRRAPSLFHWRYSDRMASTVGWLGIVVSVALLLDLPQQAPVVVPMAAWLLLWWLYQSVVNVGQLWYGFGWESLLLEVGFLAVFLGAADDAPPVLVFWLLRWLLFRLELGAGLIKLRGDACWRDLTCLRYHHETQPMPNPLSRWFHHLPMPLHKLEVLANHGTQLVVPWFLFAPEPVSSSAAIVMVVTQLWLMLSGNFSWLNFLTIALGISAIDGSALEAILPVDQPAALDDPPAWHVVLTVVLAALVAFLSRRPVRNMLSRRQAMNAAFDALHLVNTYGAFGGITKVRHEIVIEGTTDGATWLEYEFKGKPGDVRRRPRQYAPYHLRLDWLMWFAALSPGYAERWFARFLERLLEGDRATLRLLRHSPFPADAPPATVRARFYRYRYTTREERKTTGAWWHRTLVGEFWPPTELRSAPADASVRR